jgi:ribosomal protein S12 methylthiotransferase accessory factor YcaO
VRLPGEAACVGESNGNAAGGTLTEAIVHGGLELIERDHVAIWWYNRLRRPAVDLDAVGDPWLDRVRAHVRTLGRELWVLDLTADLGIPVAAAVSCAADGSDVRLGFGAHLALGAASVRAVTELVQLGLGAPSGGLGTGPGAAVRASGDSFLRPDPALSAPRADETAPAHNAAEALTRLRAPLEREGLELIVLDQTRPDIELPVVKVIVPGLRHFWPRLGPGRLYDVPAELGWLPAPLAEGDLNPEPPAV